MRRAITFLVLVSLFTLSFLPSTASRLNRLRLAHWAKRLPDDSSVLAETKKPNSGRKAEKSKPAPQSPTDEGAIKAVPRDPKFFGLTLTDWQYDLYYGEEKGWNLFKKDLDQDISYMKDLKVYTVWLWSTFPDTEAGAFDTEMFNRTKYIVDKLTQNGIEVVIQISGSNYKPRSSRTTSASTEMRLPENIGLYGRHLKEMATRLKGKVRAWHLMQELNAVYVNNSPSLYAKVLKTSYDTLKAVDPSNLVLLGSVHTAWKPTPEWAAPVSSGNDTHYLRSLVRELERSYSQTRLFDVATVHAWRYPYGPMEKNPASGKTLAQEMDAIKAELDRSRLYRGTKIWVTNIGWPGKGTQNKYEEATVSEPTQADFLYEAFAVISHKDYVERVYWMQLRDAPLPEASKMFENYPKFEAYLGLMRYNPERKTWEKKPAYEVFRDLPRRS